MQQKSKGSANDPSTLMRNYVPEKKTATFSDFRNEAHFPRRKR